MSYRKENGQVMAEAPPAGYHHEWVTDEDWQVPGDGRKCSKAGCLNIAIALLRRRHARFPSGFAWWGYCGGHLYGLNTIRKIEDGVVKVRRLVKNETPTIGSQLWDRLNSGNPHYTPYQVEPSPK
jgi:hypothetical protein